ncbi:DUF1579 domain-containing protein [Sinomicrobium pectinilyticum]|uniref:DUF1579 domain-containing protein n=1 Tax=Sinomicrobium pectinilyticum TaxID=1084421 RepID=A0A3N0ESK2_SINP1|nr:DUF1579 domain-containing protein [Sinomicrobium pectinilyticum]RNL90752.1 DUF1579 domain-containing protein [Sinomicrobium pectinilyticum]
MKTRILTPVCAVLMVLGIQNLIVAQEKEAASVSDDPQAAMMEAWSAYRTPGNMHKMLAMDEGVWNADITHWADPSAPPQTAGGTEVCEMVMGGRYLKTSFEGEFMGESFNGLGFTGYDNAKKEFFATWMDDMGTGIMIMRGAVPEDGSNTLEMKGSMVDPMTGNDLKVREVISRIDENTRMMEMFMEHDGAEMKTMEIKYSRKK